MSKLNIIFVILSILSFLIILELVRRKQLREKYSLLWFFIVFVMVLVFFSKDLIISLSLYLGIYYPPTLVFIGAVIGLAFLVLMLSVIDSHQTDRIISLTQRIALLENKIEKLSSNKKNTKKNY